MADLQEQIAQQMRAEEETERTKRIFIATAKILAKAGVSPTTLLKSAAAKAGAKAKPRTTRPGPKKRIVKDGEGNAFMVEEVEGDVDGRNDIDYRTDQALAGTRDEELATER
jgi:hypothetical protein